MMAKPHKIEQHLKKESLLKFDVKLKPKPKHIQSQRWSKAKADPNKNLSQSQRWAKAIGMVITGIDTAVGLHWLYKLL